jgi:fatty-acyl-CoA synthase
VGAQRPFSRHLAELVTETARRTPDAPAVIDGDGTLTWARLDERVDAHAHGLRDLGLRRGGTLGLLCTNRAAWLCAALGAHRLGARVAAFNTFSKAWDLEYMLAHSEAEVLVCVRRFRRRDYGETLAELLPGLADGGRPSAHFPHLREVVLVGEESALPGTLRLDDVVPERATPLEPTAGSVADDAFVLYTSGSSARPKAVPLQHYGIVENGFAIGERAGLHAADRVLVPVPLFWAYGAINALPATFTHGAALVLQEAFEPAGAVELVERHRCTAAYTLPNLTAAMVSAPGFDRARVASLRTGLTIGTPADLRRAMDGLGLEGICNVYGSTETYGNCCVTPAAWPRERRASSQGPPLPGVRLRIVDPGTGTVLPHGEVGEIQVAGPYLARGYLGHAGAGGSPFGPDGWYATGDLGALDADGALRFSTRATEMIKTGGINVAPREVEEFLGLHPAVVDVAVVGVPDAALDEVPVAFVVPRRGADVTAGELLAFCRERIAAYKVPPRIHVVDALPVTDTGKLARRRLVELDQIEEGSAA